MFEIRLPYLDAKGLVALYDETNRTSYMADPLNFDSEQATMDHIISRTHYLRINSSDSNVT